MGQPLRLLFLEGSEDDLALVRREVQRAGYDVAHTRVEQTGPSPTSSTRGRPSLRSRRGGDVYADGSDHAGGVGGLRGRKLNRKDSKNAKKRKSPSALPGLFSTERVMGFEPTISCLGSKRSTTELHPQF